MENEYDNTKAGIAQLLGEDPRDIKIVGPSREWALRQGIIVKLHIGRWRAIVSLIWDDLGNLFSAEDRWTLEQRLNLGHKYLLPKEIIKEFSSIEYQARANLARRSFKTHWGYFVPVTSYRLFKENNRECESRYLALVDSVYSRWDEISKEVNDGHAKDAAIAWKTARKLDLDPLDEKQTYELEEFSARYVARLTANRRSRDEFKRSCKFETELLFVPLPGFRDVEEAYVQQLQDEVGTAAILAQAQAEMEKDVLRQVKREKEELIDEFIGDVLKQLMIMTDRIMRDVQAGVQRNKYVPSKTAGKLRALIEGVRQLNFLNVEKVEEAIKPVEFLLNKTGELSKPDKDFLQQHTNKFIDEIRKDLDRLGSFRGVPIRDQSTIPEAGELRRGPRLSATEKSVEPSADELRRGKRLSEVNPADQIEEELEAA